MASNKTKLADASAKSAFDFDDDFSSMFDDEPKAKKGSAIRDFMSGFKDGVLDKNKNKSLLRAFITNGAPKGYDRLFGVYDQARDGITSVKDHLERTNPGDLQYLFKRAESFLPSMKGKLSESNYDRLSGVLSHKVDQYKYQIEANQDQTRLAIRRQKQQDETTIQEGLGADLRSAVDQGTVVQRSLFNKGQEADQRRWDIDRIERGLRDQVENQHQQRVARGLAQAVDSLTRMASYTEQVDYDFKRKGLELQFRSYMAMRDISKMTEASLEMQNRAFQAIVRNTGLPDHLKSSMKDLVGMNMRQGMAQAGSSMVGKTLSSFLGNYGSTVQNRVNQKASGALSGIVQGLQAGDSMSGLWDERYRLAGGLAADGAHSLMRGTVAPIVGRMARPLMTRLSNKHGRGKHNQVGYGIDNMPAMMQEFVNNYQNSYGAKGVLQDMLRPFVPQFGLDTKTQAGNYQTIGQHTAFNQLSQRTLTEILPGFQARILRELRMLRTGKEDVPMEVFDITKGMFTTAAQAKTAAMDRIITKGTVRMVSGQMNESLDRIDADGKLSPGARKALSERLLRDASTNKRFDPMRYGTKYGYKEGTSKETLAELETFFKDQFERDDKGKFADTAKNHEKRKMMSDAFLNVRNVSRDPAQEIHRLIAAGKTDQLRELGILETIDGEDRINYPMLWSIMSKDVSMQHGNGARMDSNGDASSAQFVGPQYPGQFSARAQSAAVRFLEGPQAKAAKDAAKRGFGNARDIMDQFKADPGQFMRDQYEAGSIAAKGRYQNIKDSGQAAMDAAKAGGLPAIMQHFSVKEKLDMAKALLNNVIDKEPPEMREARLKLAQTLINSIESGKDKAAGLIESGKAQGQALLATDQGQAALAKGNDLLALGHDTAEQIRASEAAGVVDLHVKDAKEVAIRAIDMARGKLIDVNTGKIIQRAADITGEVRNHLNQQVLSAEEAARGLYDNRGQLITKAREKLDSIQAIIKQHTQQTISSAKDKLDDMKDWCLEGSDRVIIRSRELLDGMYLDEETQEPIYSLDDIKGGIIDQYGRVVATAQELAKGLRSIDGKRFDIAGVKERLRGAASRFMQGNTTQNIFAALKMGGQMAWNLARNTATRIMGDRDAYLPGEPKPVLTVEKLNEGQYFNEKGDVIKSFGDINGPVFDANGEPLLDKKELKTLVGVDGKKHKIAKNRGLIRRAVKGYWNLSKKYWGALGRELGNDAKAGALTAMAPLGAFTKRQLANLSTTDQVLVQIRDAIRETVPKKNRKGSWMDQKETKDSEDKAKDAKDQAEKKENKGMFGRLTGALGALWGKMTGKKKDEDEEEDESLTDKVQDGLSTAADLKDLAGGRKGRLGRLGKRIGGSRLGKAATRFLGPAATRIAASAGGQMIARGAVMAGTFLAGLVSAPVLIGAAAVAGVGIAGYFTYKYFAGVKGEFMSVRMLQYGITSTRQRHKILALEKMFEKTALRGQQPQLNINGNAGKDMIDIMGFDATDEASIHRFARWMDKRFKPVFCTWLKGIDTIGQTQMSLADIEEKVDDKLKGTLLKEIVMPYGDDSVFGCRDNPFGDDEPLDDTQAETKERIEELTKKYKIDPDAAKAELPGKQPSKDAENNKETGPGAAVAGIAAGAATKAAVDAKAAGDEANKSKAEAAKSVSATIAGIAKGAGAVAAGTSLANGVMPIPLVSQSLPALDSIRARAYGMEKLTKSDMESLIAMETRFDLQSKADQTGQVKFTGNMESFISGAGGLFGLNTADHGADRIKFVNWLLERFIPVCEAFLTSMRGFYRGKPGEASTAMKLGDQVRSAKAIMGALSPDGTSIWKSKSIFTVAGSLDDLKRSADLDLEHLTQQADAVLSSPTMSAGAQAQGSLAAAAGKSFVDGALDAVSSTLKSAGEFVSGAAGAVGNAVSSAASNVANFTTGAATAVGGAIKSAANSTYEFFGGNTGTLTKGNGGKWEQIPMPTSKDAKGSRKTMEVVAQMTGVPVEFLMVFCAMESNFDWTVKAGAGGSATGWFQFINSTWDWMVGLNTSKYGLPADSIPARPLRLDPRINALLGAEYMKMSMEKIQKTFNRPATDIDLYLAHFLGPDTAVKWLKLPQNTLGYTAFPKEAASNPSIFYGPGRQPRTLAEIMASFDKRMAKFRSMAGASGGPMATPLTTEEVAKAQEAANAKKLEMEGKDKDFIPGVSAMPGGPSATGSTPTNVGTGGATMTPAGSGGAQSPAGGTAPVGVMAPSAASGAPQEEPSSGGGMGSQAGSQTSQAAKAAQSALDAQRAKDVKQSTTNDAAIMSVQQEQLQTQKEMLAVLKQMAAGGGGQSNSMPTQQGRSANRSPFPVNV